MKKYLLITLFLIFAFNTAEAKAKRYTILFYNVENMFDTIDSPKVVDTDFTPQGLYRWNTVKYNKKMANMEKVFYTIATGNRSFPTIIGLAEIENRNVLEDMVSLKKIQKANYQIVHYDSPGRRGIDVAFLYRPDQFVYEGSQAIEVKFDDAPNYKTRDILAVWGKIEGEEFMFMVAHWPSRYGGHVASKPRRATAAQISRAFIDSVAGIRPETKFVFMGDLNDNPIDESIYTVLGAKGNPKTLKEGELFNPYYKLYKDGHGTIGYQDAWSLFDNIIVSQNLANKADDDKLSIVRLKKDYYGKICNRPFLIHKSGQFKGYPLRTFNGNDFINGFSDHLPVYIYLEKGGFKRKLKQFNCRRKVKKEM